MGWRHTLCSCPQLLHKTDVAGLCQSAKQRQQQQGNSPPALLLLLLLLLLLVLHCCLHSTYGVLLFCQEQQQQMWMHTMTAQHLMQPYSSLLLLLACWMRSNSYCCKAKVLP
jgi:hypothetical protein